MRQHSKLHQEPDVATPDAAVDCPLRITARRCNRDPLAQRRDNGGGHFAVRLLRQL